MRTRRTWGWFIAALAVALVAAAGFAPRAAWATDVTTADDLTTALAATSGDDVVTLADDVELTSAVTVAGTKTLDLNGCNITGSSPALVSVPAGASLTIQDDSAEPGSISGGTDRAVLVNGELTLAGGTIDSKGGQAVLINGGGSKLTMTGGTIHGSNEALRGQWATIDISGGTISTDAQASESGPLMLLASDATFSGDARIEGYYGVTLFNITSAGAVDNDATSDPSSFTMNGGTIDCYVFAISGNNTQSATCSATINGGTITAEDTAIYWPMEGNLTVNGGSITGGNSIEAKMGTINITGGTLRGTVEAGFAYSSNGSASDGSAIKVVGQLYGGAEGQFINDPSLTVSVTGGTLESANGNAMTVYVDDVTHAYGGNLAATIDVSPDATLVPAENYDGLRATSVGDFTLTETGATTGNTVINSPELAAAAVVANGKTQTSASTSQNGNTLYTSIERAIASATSADVMSDEGATVTLLRDVEENVTIPKDTSVKLDLGEHTLTGSVENNGTLELAGNGEVIGQVTGNELTGDSNVTISVARIGDKSYPTLEAAIAAAQDGDAIELVANATVSSPMTLSSKNVALNGNGYSVTAADDAADGFADNDSSLLTVTGSGAKISDITLVGGKDTKHVLNIWCAGDATLTDVALDRTAQSSRGGAPLVINNTDVTVDGAFDITAGVGSWYGINLDNKYGETSLTFAESAAPSFTDLSGQNLDYIKAENSAGETDSGYGKGDPSIVNNNPMVEIPEDGSTLHVHEAAVERVNVVPATCTERGYTGDIVCVDCDTILQKGEDTAPLGHTTEHVARVEPTATTPGNIEYWHCTACDCYFADAECQTEITALDATVLPALGEEKPGPHTVTLVYGFDLESKTYLVADGSAFPEPAAPSVDGWTFVGWFSTRAADGTVSGEYDFTKPVADDLMLYAGWVPAESETEESATNPAPEAEKPADKGDGLAQTSDPTAVAPLVASAVAGIGVVAGAVALRRRSK